MSLSDKKEYLPKDCYGNLGFDYFNFNDVKEAIKKLKDTITKNDTQHYIEYGESMPISVIQTIINQIFGKELCEEERAN